MLSVRNWFFSTVSVFPFWSTEAKWHIPSTKILNPLKQREGGKDSPNKLSRVNAWPTLISVSQQLPTWHFSGSVYKFIVSLFGRLFNAFSCSLYMGCLRSRCPTLHCQIWFRGEVKLPLFMDFAATGSTIGVFTLICATLCTYHFPFISMLMGVSSHHRFCGCLTLF